MKTVSGPSIHSRVIGDKKGGGTTMELTEKP